MVAIARRTRTRDTNIWPGFVDALATLLMVIIFALMIFIVSQFYLTQLLSGRDEALSRLEREVSELLVQLRLERETTAELRLDMAQLSAELQSSIAARDTLAVQMGDLTEQNRTLDASLAAVLAERDELSRRLVTIEGLHGDLDTRVVRAISERDALLAKLNAVEMEVQLSKAERDELQAGLTEAMQIIETSRETISLQLRELEALRRDIAALKTVRQELERDVLHLSAVRTTLETDLEESRNTADLTKADLETARELLDSLVRKLAASRAESRDLADEGDRQQARTAELVALLTTERSRIAELETRLADAENRTSLAQKEIEQRDIRLAELLSSQDLAKTRLSREQQLSQQAQRRVERLQLEIQVLNQRLREIQAALDASEVEAQEQQVTIVNLTKRLNEALLNRVQELSRFRSVFFGEMRKILQGRKDIRIVGDRFVFQSEVLFASGSDQIARQGRRALRRVAEAFDEIRPRIPQGIDWILQVEGHTDAVPIETPDFPSNWHLSAARAISVVRFLQERGVPPERLTAAGYGEFRPVESGVRESRKNRRIEIKLTQR